MARSFFSGFFTTIVFVAVIVVVMGGIFLVTSLLAPGGARVPGY